MNHQVVCTADGLLPVGYKIQGYSTIHSHKGTWKDWLSKTIGMKQDFWKSLEFSKINWGRSSELEWCTVYFSLVSPMNLTNHFRFFYWLLHSSEATWLSSHIRPICRTCDRPRLSTHHTTHPLNGHHSPQPANVLRSLHADTPHLTHRIDSPQTILATHLKSQVKGYYQLDDTCDIFQPLITGSHFPIMSLWLVYQVRTAHQY